MSKKEAVENMEEEKVVEVVEEKAAEVVEVVEVVEEKKIDVGTIKRKHDIVDLLECPVCLETPRRGPIYNCSNGHVLCADCQTKTKTCPTCRCKKIDCRNIIAEKLLAEALVDRVVSCRLKTDGCNFQALSHRVHWHEQLCVYRTVSCPTHGWSSCTWTGQLRTLLQHIVEKRCAQVTHN